MSSIKGKQLFDSGWVAPTMANSWVNYGGTYTTAGYRKIGNVVYLKGLIKNGTIGQYCFTLPAGYRPPNQSHFVVPSFNAYGQVKIDNSGNVYIQQGNTGWLSLDGMCFLGDN